MVNSFVGEEWKDIPFGNKKPAKNYAVSNYGRVVSYKESIEKDGYILKHQYLKGYPMINSDIIRNNHTAYIHKLVAKFFRPNNDKDKKYVIHLDYNKTNNNVENLRW